MNKKNIILADCEEFEIKEFTEGLKEKINDEFIIKSKICNGKQGKINNICRYICYCLYPIKFFISRKKYNYVIGWQQFFSLFYIFYCNLFKVKKENIIIVLNFTYKEKKGIIGRMYKRFFLFCLNNEYVDYIHVPSKKYSEMCAQEFNIPIEKFIVTTFGLPDTSEKWKDSKVEYENYSLAIGRSNRDYDFLINSWNLLPNEEKLIIICDNYENDKQLPENIIIKKDIVGEKQYPYIMNCKLMIIPIKDGNICSGDTVLLKAMSYCKPIIITTPSTLAEMYIENEKNGVCLPKDEDKFAKGVSELLNNNEKMKKIAQSARETYLEKYSRKIMGEKIGKCIMKNEQ